MTDPFVLPDGFLFGVATAGFQVEGGYNGPDEPANNWARWEQEGRVEPSGVAIDFWNRYEEHLDRAVAAGCSSFRLSVEWARCEPAPGEIDTDSLDHYIRILRACHQRGLEPVVTLHHFTHPAWLGDDLWLALDSPERFARWVATAVGHLADHCRSWVTINEINILALGSYVIGAFPPGRMLSTGDFVRCLDHLLAAHVLAYGEIKRIQPDSTVATNSYCFSIYELDRLLTDVLLARHHGVDRHGLGGWLARRRRTHHTTVGASGPRESLLRRWAATTLHQQRGLPRAVSAVYDSVHPSTLDVVQIDFYNPVVSSHIRLPFHRTAGGRQHQPSRALWDDPLDAAAHARHLGLNAAPGLDLWVLENGMCNRVRRGRSYPRLDGLRRPDHLRANLGAVVAALDAGIPVGGYWHWTLADNYEWGSYEPRFGLYGVDRERGARVMATDAMGDDSAGAYREIIQGLRAGDRSVVD